MHASPSKRREPTFITNGKNAHKGWLVTCQTPPQTQLPATEKRSRIKGFQGERWHIALPAWEELSKTFILSHAVGFQKKPLPGAFGGRGVNAVIRDGAAISGWGEGAPSVAAICSQIKITTRVGRSAAASKVILIWEAFLQTYFFRLLPKDYIYYPSMLLTDRTP